MRLKLNRDLIKFFEISKGKLLKGSVISNNKYICTQIRVFLFINRKFSIITQKHQKKQQQQQQHIINNIIMNKLVRRFSYSGYPKKISAPFFNFQVYRIGFVCIIQNIHPPPPPIQYTITKNCRFDIDFFSY